MERLLRFGCCVFCWVILSLTAAHGQRDWTVQLRNPQVFIENLGQYDALSEGFPARPRYVIDHGFGWQVMATDHGLQYLVQRTERTPEGERMEGVSEWEDVRAIERSTITMEFVGAQASHSLAATGPQPDYYTYSYPVADEFRNVDQATAYAELRYAGLWPGIDATVTGPEAGGVKYNFHLAAGADASAIRLRWTGATPALQADGDLHLPAVLGELVDQKPTAWYADAPSTLIPVQFRLQGNTVSFELGSYDHNRAIVIDPWTVNPALPAPFNRAFEVDVDNAGNVYVFGGGMGYNLKKYNAAGTLQWTHVSPWDTSNAWFGELLTLGTGDCFITSGSAAKIRRLTTAGATTFTNNGPFLNMDEYWTLTLNCDGTKLVSGGSRIVSLTSPQGFVFDLNLANGNQIAGSPYNVSPVGMKEIRALCVGGNGNFYLLSNDNLIALNQTFGIVYSIASGTSHPYYSPQYMAKNVQGQNIIDANTTDIYVARGTNVERRAIGTGAITTTVAIPGGGFTGGFLGSGPANGGLVLDNCNNVYVGSTNQVLKYDAALTQLATVATTGAVYDIVVAPGNTLIWGGNGFVTSNTTLAPCVKKAVSCIILPVTLDQLEGSCHGDIVSLRWRSLSEQNHDRYVVERTQDGYQWETRGTLAGQGTRTTPTDYVWTESEKLPDPDAPWYYRLRMIDGDGNASLSGIVAVEACAQADPTVRVVPTVAETQAQLHWQPARAGAGHVTLLHPLGGVVRKVPAQWGAGAQATPLNLSGLAAGIYLVRVTDDSGAVLVRDARVVVE